MQVWDGMLFVLLIYHTPTHNDSAIFPQILFVAIYKNHKAFDKQLFLQKLLQVNVPIVLNSLDTGGNGMGGNGKIPQVLSLTTLLFIR